MKRVLTVTCILLLLLSMLAGCGAKSADRETAAMDAPAATAPMEEVLYDEAVSGSASGTQMPAGQKLIRTVNMEAETLAMDPLMQWIDNRVAELGGYYEQKSVRRSGSRDDGSYFRYADLTVRIPAENLDGFLTQMGEKANIIFSSESTENVTLTYVSTQSRVKALETEEKRLLELLENAETMEDLLTIESRLTDVRWELENYASQLRVLDNQVNYSTIYLSVREVDKPTIVVERTAWQKIGDGLSENTVKMWKGTVNFFVGFTVILPFLIPPAVIAGVVLVILKMTVWKKKKKTPPTPEEETK